MYAMILEVSYAGCRVYTTMYLTRPVELGTSSTELKTVGADAAVIIHA